MKDEEKKSIFKNKKLSLIIVLLVVVLGLVGVTYAFFNYTRTGGTNVARTGRIYFSTDEDGDTLTLTNVFPSSSVPSGADSIAVHITGDTTYNDGEEFQITLVDVVNTVNGKTVPINYVATYVASTNKDIGTSKSTDDAYFTDRGSTTSVYKLTSSGEVTEGTEVLKGYIAKGATGIDGTLTIQAYLDSSKILISDTIQGGDIEVSGYVNGTPAAEVVLTTAEWNSLTGNNTLSFKIRTISNDGIWIGISSQDGTIPSCPGCNFMFTATMPYRFGESNNPNATALGDVIDGGYTDATPLGDIASSYSTDYRDIVAQTGSSVFMGFTTVNGKIDKAYVCGILDTRQVAGGETSGEASGETSSEASGETSSEASGETSSEASGETVSEIINNGVPFCIEAKMKEESFQNRLATYQSSYNLLNGSTLWNGRCFEGQSSSSYGFNCNNTSTYPSILVNNNRTRVFVSTNDGYPNCEALSEGYDNLIGCSVYPDNKITAECPGPKCVYPYGQIGSYDAPEYSAFFASIYNGLNLIKSYLCTTRQGNIYCLRGGENESVYTNKPIYNENVRILTEVLYSPSECTDHGNSFSCEREMNGGSYTYYNYARVAVDGTVTFDPGSYTCEIQELNNRFCQ